MVWIRINSTRRISKRGEARRFALRFPTSAAPEYRAAIRDKSCLLATSVAEDFELNLLPLVVFFRAHLDVGAGPRLVNIMVDIFLRQLW